MLRQQHERLLAWARAGKPAKAGLQLLEDIWTLADLLGSLNERQELINHDRELIAELLAETSAEPREWHERLERLWGLDDRLDVLAVQLRQSPSVGLADVRARLALLA